MYDINESEKKRLESVKQKKEQFRAKELAIQSALKNLDTKSNTNKIIFDDNVLNQIEQSNLKPKLKQKKKHLFDNDENEDEEEAIWNNSDFDVKKNYTGHTVALGNDERFKLDKRFMDDCDTPVKNDSKENNDVCDLEKEKEWQLDILGNVLGVPILSKNRDSHDDVKPTKKRMIRYDPTENDHKAYEIVPEKLETADKKIKKKKKTKEASLDVQESAPVEVSKDIFYSVSDTLTKSLKSGEGEFSLLKTYAKEENIQNSNKIDSTLDAKATGNKKFQFNFNTNASFNCDSVGDMHDAEEYNEKSITNNEQDTQDANHIFGDPDQFFFNENDMRFNEAARFFSKESMPEDEFKNLRQELKQIVRTKIRLNLKKTALWGGKRKVRKLK